MINQNYNNDYSVIATKVNGNLYISYGDNASIKKTIGTEIKFYNNLITKFFTRLLNQSMDVAINGKIYTVNKESFKKHIVFAGLIKPNLKDFKTLNYTTVIQQNHDQIEFNKTSMSEIISEKKQKKLSIKLIHAIKNHQTQRAIDLINKGASFDKMIYFPHSNGTSYFTDKKEANKFTVHRAKGIDTYSNYDVLTFYGTTALAMSVHCHNDKISQFIFREKKQCINVDSHITFEADKSGAGVAVVRKVEVLKMNKTDLEFQLNIV